MSDGVPRTGQATQRRGLAPRAWPRLILPLVAVMLVVAACQNSDAEDVAPAAPVAGGGDAVELPAAGDTAPVGSSSPAVDLSGIAAWSDPTIWPDGQVPGPGQHVTIPADLQLRVDQDIEVAGLAIDGQLYLDPATSVTLSSDQNIVVNGLLHMKPADPTVQHVIEFANVNEGAFVGGGIDVLDSDVGLWVVGEGQIVVEGSPRRGWTNVLAEVPSGTDTVEVADATGWQVGDEVVLTPTAPPTQSGSDDDEDDEEEGEDFENLSAGFHETTISAIDGNTVTFAEPPSADHPMVGGQYGPELMNLTRNVIIRGTEEGRSHVFVHGHSPQFIRWASLDDLGVEEALGRYPLHFHHGFEGVQGSLVEGVVVRDGGHHGFVPHLSHGITMRDLVAYRITGGDAYWWDEAEETHDLVLEHVMAAATANSGFFLGRGTNMTIRDAVSVGVKNQFNDGGFEWENEAVGTWIAEDLVAHNNASSGIRVWQNADIPQVVDGFVAYHNDQAAIDHGAYSNRYVYRNGHFIGNGISGVILHATSDVANISFENVVIDSAGMMEGSFVTMADANVSSELPIVFRDVEFIGETDQPVFNFATETETRARCINCSWPDGTEPAVFTPGTPDASWLEVVNSSSSQRYGPDGTVEDVAHSVPSTFGTGEGLTVQYFDDTELSELVYETLLPVTIDNWVYEPEQPNAGVLPYWLLDITDGSSSRWVGELEVAPGDGGAYTLYTASAAGVRLWIDEELLIDDWDNTEQGGDWNDPDSSGYNQVAVDLAEGRHSFRLESVIRTEGDEDEEIDYWDYFLSLHWQPEGGEQQIIPSSQLYATGEVPSYEPVPLEVPQ